MPHNSKIGIVSRIIRYVYVMLHYVLIMDFCVVALEQPMVGFKEIAVLAACMMISYFMRERLTRIIGIIIVHVALSVGIFYIIQPGIPKWTLICIIMVECFMAARYMQQGYRLPTVFDVPWPSFLLFLAVVGFGLYNHSMDLVKMCFVIAVFIYLVYILMVYLQNLENYIFMMKNVSAMPVDKIIPMNTIVVCGIFVIMVVVIVLANLLGFNDALRALGRALVVGLRVIFRVFVILYKIVAGLISPSSSGSGYERDVVLIQEEVKGTNVIEIIFMFTLKLFLIGLAVFLVIKLFKKIYDTILEKRARFDSDTFTRIKKPDMRNTKKEKIVKEKDDSRFSMEQRARKIYKKRVEAVKKKYVPTQLDTPSDIAEHFTRAQEELQKEGGSIEELTTLYEAVRYGTVKPDADYLRKMQRS